MITIKEKQLKTLNDTIKAFNIGNLCITEKGMCRYYIEGKQGCAVGRLIEDKELCKKLDLKGNTGFTNTGITNTEIFNQLPDELKELTQDFLYHLQKLHDFTEFWNIDGLNKLGLEEVEIIKTKFEL